jgi:DNA-binding XRE family transcriptional regulator
MSDRILGNRLRMHRRKAGLSQRELGQLVGYKRRWPVSRHERSRTAPPLLTALAYEAVFGVPVSAIFTGIHETVAQGIEQNIGAFEKELRDRNSKSRRPNETAQKLEWLTQRRSMA